MGVWRGWWLDLVSDPNPAPALLSLINPSVPGGLRAAGLGVLEPKGLCTHGKSFG